MGGRFALATALNVAMVTMQVVYGLLAHSTALLADAGHNFGDAFGILLAWGAYTLSRRTPTEHFTYGLGSSSILAALFNGIILMVATGAIAWEAVGRFQSPQPIDGHTVIVVAAIAVVCNSAAAWLLMTGDGDINVRGAFLHMVADAAVSAGVVVAGFGFVLTGWDWIDPAMSLVICAAIVWGTWGLLRQSVTMTLQAVPRGIEPKRVRAYLQGRPGVSSIHDLHIWPMSTTATALTCHLVMPDPRYDEAFMKNLSDGLRGQFGIEHATIQIECYGADCHLAPDHVV